jgi:mannose-6-phosphate isomerase-like protein (cupin superfamily)
MQKINIAGKMDLFTDYFNPRIIGELNGQQVKAVKFQGEFIWHHHDNEDEMFLVTKGSFTMELREKNIEINEGEFIIIPRGTEHRPVAKNEVHLLLFEPATTINTGQQQHMFTRTELEKL